MSAPSECRPFHFRHVVPLWTVSGAVLVLGLATIELIEGHWFSPSPIHRLNIPRNVRCDHATPNGHLLYTRDKWGLRGSYADLAKIDILTIGGSTTEQREISDGETWQDEPFS